MRLFIQPFTILLGLSSIGLFLFQLTHTSSAKISYGVNSSRCLPLLRSSHNNIHLFTHHCSDAAIEAETDDIDLEADFEIPDEMTRRVHFWVKIFSHYSANEYILHSSNYPELIFEIASVSKDLSKKDQRERKKDIETYFKKISNIYREALLELAEDPDNINTNLKQKFVRELAHIDHDDKYKKAAEKFRIQRGQANAMLRGLNDFSAYEPHIFKAFRDQNIPTELSYLTFVESTFNRRAVSKVGASGVYQIMPKTGRPHMRINRKFDERRDPLKSAIAAAKILKKNYQITKEHWPLAITGYNHGAYGMKKAANMHDTYDIWELINKYEGRTFGFASKNFYAEFVAINYIIENKRQLFPKLKNKIVIPIHSLTARRKVRISSILKKYDISLEDFISFNPDLNKKYRKARTLLPVGYRFKIDKRKYEAWVSKQKFWKSDSNASSEISTDLSMVSN